MDQGRVDLLGRGMVEALVHNGVCKITSTIP